MVGDACVEDVPLTFNVPAGVHDQARKSACEGQAKLSGCTVANGDLCVDLNVKRDNALYGAATWSPP